MNHVRKNDVQIYFRSGALLVEVIIALSLGILFAVAIVKMGLGTFDSIRNSRDQLVATHYASDGIEAIRTIARQKFSLLEEGTHGVNFGTSYSLSGTGNTLGKYWRSLTLSPVYRYGSGSAILNPADPDTILANGGWKDIQAFVVDSVVEWNEVLRTRQVSIQFVVTKWFTYPLQEVEVGTGGLYHGTQWDNAITLANQPTFSPPAEIGFVSGPTGEAIIKMLVDASEDFLYVITAEGTVTLYSLETESTGTLVEIASTSLLATLSDAVLIGDYLYVASTSNSSEVSVLNTGDLSLVRTWDLPGNSDVLSTNKSVDEQWLLIGRENGETGTASGDVLLLTPDPLEASPIMWQKDTGYDVSSIVSYTSDWVIFGTNRTENELGFLQISNMNISECNLQGAQLISDIGIMENTIILSRRSGVDDTLSAFTLSPADPSNCNTYDTPIWSNGISGTDMEDIFIDVFEARIYSLTDETSLHFHFNDVSPSAISKHTISTGNVCSEIAGDESLLFVACNGVGANNIYLLDGGGVDRVGYVSSGTYISPPFLGGPSADWRAIYWNGSGGIIRLKIRTASGYSMLPNAQWVGPNGGTGAYFTTSGTGVDPFESAGGTQWVQVKAWLSHTGATLPIIKSIILLLK